MRNKTRRHKQLEILSYRYDLSDGDLTELRNLDSGFHGEIEFDHILEKEFADMHFIHIKDFCFKVGKHVSSTKSQSSVDQEVQIDNIIIAGDRMITFEIKNYHFDLNYADGQWTYINGRKFGNPILQVERQRLNLQALTEETGLSISVFSTAVFINAEQTIYNLPDKPEIIVRSNLMKKLKKVVYPNRNDYSHLLAGLEARRLPESQYQGYVGVLFEELKTGVFCGECGQRLEKKNQQVFKCLECKGHWTMLAMINQLIYEIKTLNENWRITPSLVSRFSGKEISEGCIRRHKKEKNITLE